MAGTPLACLKFRLIAAGKTGQEVSMNQETSTELRDGYCIFINTVCEGTVPLWTDGKGWPVVYATEREAQLEIVDDLQLRLEQFLAGERDFDDAITVEECVLPVSVHPDGVITDENGNVFGPRVD
jgi:hypothetical protein